MEGGQTGTLVGSEVAGTSDKGGDADGNFKREAIEPDGRSGRRRWGADMAVVVVVEWGRSGI